MTQLMEQLHQRGLRRAAEAQEQEQLACNYFGTDSLQRHQYEAALQLHKEIHSIPPPPPEPKPQKRTAVKRTPGWAGIGPGWI